MKNCTSAFADDVKELNLLKTQTRLVAGRRTRELLTGAEIAESMQIGVMDSHPLFNTPLVHSDQVSIFHVHVLASGSHSVAMRQLPLTHNTLKLNESLLFIILEKPLFSFFL